MRLFSNVVLKMKPIFFGLLLFCFAVNMQAQDKDSKEKDSLKTKDIIEISNIAEETEKLGQRIIKLRKILLPSTKISTVDSLVKIVSKEVAVQKDSLQIRLENINRRDLRVFKIEWVNYKSSLSNHQDVLKERSEEISDISDEVIEEIDKWDSTKKIIKNRDDSSGIYAGLDKSISTLNEILEKAYSRLDTVFLIQNKLTSIVLEVDEAISEIDLAEKDLQRDYFVIDSSPLWSSKKIDSIGNQNIEGKPIQFFDFNKRREQISVFFSQNIKTFIFQILFILLLFILIIKAGKNWNMDVSTLNNPIEIQTKTVLSNPISSTIVVGILLSFFFYTTRIPDFSELTLILLLLSTIYLLPKLTILKFRLFLILTFISFFIYSYEESIDVKSNLDRYLMILNSIILIVAFEYGRRIIVKNSDNFKALFKFYKRISPVFIVFMVVSIVANIIGMVGLSSFLIRGILLSTLLGMIVYLVVKVITSLVILLFKIRKTVNIQTLSTMIEVSHQRIQPTLNFLGFLLWIRFTLIGFDLYDFIFIKLADLMNVKWELGEMTISFGGILAFVGIFSITLIIAKLLAKIFQDQWMINILPRGAASALSLMFRIVIIVIGLYIGFSAVGLDLSKLGIIIGALGVGIGFGLQNVVLNFIAGLILAFERPINLGDTIEIDQEKGIVTNIGVRSSNIKTFSGAEAIIPNGDLISKKVINWTLSNRDRRSKILMKTDPGADPEEVIELLNSIASEYPKTLKNPAPKTYFYGYGENGNLNFSLMYWTTFSDTLISDHEIALKIFKTLKEKGIQAPAPVRRIIKEG